MGKSKSWEDLIEEYCNEAGCLPSEHRSP